MGWDAGRHSDCDSLRPVYKEIRHTHGKNKRLLLCLIKVRSKVNDILVQICKTDFLCKFRKPCLRITHGSRPISFDGSEVSVPVHKDLPLLEILRHDNERLVDRAVAVRMVFTHRISDNTGAFPVRSVIADPQLIHVIERTSLNRFQTVPNIRKRTGDNNAHGIVDI